MNLVTRDEACKAMAAALYSGIADLDQAQKQKILIVFTRLIAEDAVEEGYEAVLDLMHDVAGLKGAA